MRPTVAVEAMAEGTEASRSQMERAVKRLSLDARFRSASAVFIKPNLTYPEYKEGVTTRMESVESLVAVLRDVSDSPMIYVGEGEGGYNSFSMSGALSNMGFMGLEERYPMVRVINLSKMEARTVTLATGKGPYELALPKLFFDEIDFSISCPVPKVHAMVGVSLSYKNQWGCLPDIMRLKNHYMFNHMITDIADTLKFEYAFLDGKYGLDDNGPMVGDPVELGWFAASDSLGAFDVVISRMMGFDYKRVPYLKNAAKRGRLPEAAGIDVVGDAEGLSKRFRLRRNAWNYPALAAFSSRGLTTLFYLSRWSMALHDIMYTFRKRPI